MTGRTFTFQPSDPTVTLVVRVGQLPVPSILNVTWSAILDDEDAERPLFTQQIPVSAFDQATAVALSGGRLAVGDYRVTASLAGARRTIEWFVREPQATETTRAASAGHAPVAGPASRAPAKPNGQSPRAPGGDCDPSKLEKPLIRDADSGTTVLATARDPIRFFVDSCDPVDEALVSAGGNFVPAALELHPSESNRWYFTLNPCGSLNSDLPGTKLDIIVRSPVARSNVHGTLTLGEDTMPPTLEVHSVPPQGSIVKPDQEIEVTMTATERRPQDSAQVPWQSGLLRMILYVEITDSITDRTEVGGAAPQPCDRKPWTKTWTAKKYRVPKDPSSIIQLTAYARDWDGNFSQKDAFFLTKEAHRLVWHGHIDDERALVTRALSGGGVRRMRNPATYAHAISVNFEYVELVMPDGAVVWPKRHLDWTLKGTRGDDTVRETCDGQGSLDLKPADSTQTLTLEEEEKLRAHCERSNLATAFRLYETLPQMPPLPKIPSVDKLDANCTYREEVGSRRMSVWLTPCTPRAKPGQ